MFQSRGLRRASPQQAFELGDREPPADVDLTGEYELFLKVLI